MKLLRSIARLVLGILVATLLWVGACCWWVEYSTAYLRYSDYDSVPYNDVALILGTSRSPDGKWLNLYFQYRVAAAAELWHRGKVRHLLVSGDNHTARYNEPLDMRQALVAMDVPDSCITMDFAGRRTLDSVVRCLKVFGQRRVLIVSQGFHNARALFIAQRYGMEAVAFDAPAPSGGRNKMLLRESLARARAVLDLYLWKTPPRFLGDSVPIRL